LARRQSGAQGDQAERGRLQRNEQPRPDAGGAAGQAAGAKGDAGGAGEGQGAGAQGADHLITNQSITVPRDGWGKEGRLPPGAALFHWSMAMISIASSLPANGRVSPSPAPSRAWASGAWRPSRPAAGSA